MEGGYLSNLIGRVLGGEGGASVSLRVVEDGGGRAFEGARGEVTGEDGSSACRGEVT